MRWPWQIKDVDIKDGASARWACMERYMIPDERGGDYVRRLRIVQTPWFGIYLHDILAPDEQDPHDHPWAFLGIILNGAYIERYGSTDRAKSLQDYSLIRQRFSVRRVPLDQCHRITHVWPGTKTLIVVGPRRQEWGFYTPSGWVLWKEYQRLSPQERYLLRELGPA